MNNIRNKFLGDKFVPEMHLRQHGFTYRACRPLQKYKNTKVQRNRMLETYLSERTTQRLFSAR